jgi:hypothetical protein
LRRSKHGDDVSAGAADRSRSGECACSRPERAPPIGNGTRICCSTSGNAFAGRHETRIES